jgi:hypothetical protein
MATDVLTMRRHPLLTTLLAITLTACGGPRAVGDPGLQIAPFAPVAGYALAGRITDPGLPEISGLAVSRRDPARLWALNDGGHRPALHLIEGDGRTVARYPVTGAENIDWEDLAAFSLDGTPYLLVADFGDNFGRRETRTLYLFAEPDHARAVTVRPVAVIDFSYPEGPRDAEGLAVDAARGEILLLTKREPRPIFYRLPLHLATPEGPLVAERIGHFDNPEPRFDPPGGPVTRSLFGASPTAIDLDDTGHQLWLLTYTAVYRLVREEGETWSRALERPFARLADHPLPHAEALAVDPDGRRAWFTSERLPAPLWTIDPAPAR